MSESDFRNASYATHRDGRTAVRHSWYKTWPWVISIGRETESPVKLTDSEMGAEGWEAINDDE